MKFRKQNKWGEKRYVGNLHRSYCYQRHSCFGSYSRTFPAGQPDGPADENSSLVSGPIKAGWFSCIFGLAIGKIRNMHRLFWLRPPPVPAVFIFGETGEWGGAPAWDFSIEKLGKTLDNGPGIVYYIACPLSAAPWSSGLRHRPFTAVTGVRVS